MQLCIIIVYVLKLKYYETQRMTQWIWVIVKYHTHCVYMLECIQGDVVAVVRRHDENWFEGLHDGRQGLFPVAYVELIRLPLPSSSPHSTTSITGIQRRPTAFIQQNESVTHENSTESFAFAFFICFNCFLDFLFYYFSQLYGQTTAFIYPSSQLLLLLLLLLLFKSYTEYVIDRKDR